MRSVHTIDMLSEERAIWRIRSIVNFAQASWSEGFLTGLLSLGEGHAQPAGHLRADAFSQVGVKLAKRPAPDDTADRAQRTRRRPSSSSCLKSRGKASEVDRLEVTSLSPVTLVVSLDVPTGYFWRSSFCSAVVLMPRT